MYSYNKQFVPNTTHRLLSCIQVYYYYYYYYYYYCVTSFR